MLLYLKYSAWVAVSQGPAQKKKDVESEKGRSRAKKEEEADSSSDERERMDMPSCTSLARRKLHVYVDVPYWASY